MVNHKNHIKISGSDNYAGNPLVRVCGGAREATNRSTRKPSTINYSTEQRTTNNAYQPSAMLNNVIRFAF